MGRRDRDQEDRAAHWATVDRLKDENREMRERLAQAIQKIRAEHQPYPEAEGLRVGNHRTNVAFYCSQCRTTWPCRTFNDLEGIYYETIGFATDGQPFAPLVLTRRED